MGLVVDKQTWDAVAKRKAFQLADDAWSASLRRTFGKQASDVRYTRAGHGFPGSALRVAYNAREAARIAWEDARVGYMEE